MVVAVDLLAANRPIAPYSSVEPVLRSLANELPLELRDATSVKWDEWAHREDRRIRERLEQGALDSMVNLLLFGTSFTRQPRIQVETFTDFAKSGVLRARVDDFLRALRTPGSNERLAFLRALVRSKGIDPDATDAAAGVFVLQNLERVLQEKRTFAQRIEQAKRPGDATPEFLERSRLFRDRGISLDTSILPNFGIEEGLREMKKRGLLQVGGVRRAAVFGPGLDFTDWDSGYDYYPQQTLQPFALYDSLSRLELATGGATSITVFDISARVLEHLRLARERAQKGGAYVLQLPRDPTRGWVPAAPRYWRAFGDHIGDAVAPIPPPAILKGLETRAVRIHPSVVLSCEPQDLNIVMNRELSDHEQFDVILATNIFLYYDTLEQALALQNATYMLKPGGLLLTNTALPDFAVTSIRLAGNIKVSYAASGVGDYMIWYLKE